MEDDMPTHPFTRVTFSNPDDVMTQKTILPPTKPNNVISMDAERVLEENEIGSNRIGMIWRCRGRFTPSPI